jgi:hypothetical protein
VDKAKEMINHNSEKQAKESEARLDKKLAVLSTRVDDSINALRDDFERTTDIMAQKFESLIDTQTSFMADLTARFNDSLLKMHENIVSVTQGRGLSYPEKPTIQFQTATTTDENSPRSGGARK